jgi:3-deoxy-D-manno-octulosonic-acid transferase
MLLSAKKRNIPIMLINARLSNKSFNGYNFFPFRKFSSKIINCFSVITAQSENDKNNYLKLGFENKVYVVGNIKFDIDLHYVSSPLNMRRHMRSSLVWLGASIRTGEHIHLLNSVLEIKDTVSSTLILVPRHLKNTPTIIKDCKKRNLSVARIDEVLNDGKFDFKKIDGLDVLIVDKMGVLIDYIKEVDIVFVGGSLVNKGCQNIIEPISCSKPVIIGYSHYNFKTIIEELIKKEAICVVENYYQLSDTLLSLHEDLNKYAELIRFSSAVFSKNQGTTNKTVEIINCEYKL